MVPTATQIHFLLLSLLVTMAVLSTTTSSTVEAIAPTTTTHRVAVVGGGITGACVASTLATLSNDASSSGVVFEIHVFDQGRSGVGGRTSHRIQTTTPATTAATATAAATNDEHLLRWDHGCQFFRADTPLFRELVQNSWISEKKIAAKWEGTFVGETGGRDFFGLPSQPPFYVGTNGIKSIAHSLLHDDSNNGCITVHEGRRVANMVRDDETNKWTLVGTSGEAAFHDSSEAVAKAAGNPHILGSNYNAVVMTDVSSSFDAWHRASAGLPTSFSERVRKRAGSRVPLFTCMIAFEQDVPVNVSAATLNDPTLWFASRTKSKPGLGDAATLDCWTLVSTPEYAMQAITETPMQDPNTGAFIPQPPEYLTTVPGPQLEAAFRKIVEEGRLGEIDADMPKTAFLNAQRWGSALPANRHLDETSSTRQVISGVAYDSGAAPLSPTTKSGSGRSFVADEEQMLFQAGDMVATCYTPGFEGAALSGMEAAAHIHDLLTSK